MIIVRSPLRISLGGGGTDLPSYYKEHEGFLVSAAIDKYVYITLHKTFEDQMIIKYSKLEKVKKISEIEHPIIKEALNLLNYSELSLEISSMADIPSGTGLGSSGSFTTALLMALHTYKKNIINKNLIAQQACAIEIEKLQEPIGKQDQYISAIGGLTAFNFLKNGEVKYNPLQISNDTLYNLEDNLMLYFTGFSRKASSILKDQNEKSKENDKEMTENLHFTKDLGRRSAEEIQKGNLEEFAYLMHEHWLHKKKRSKGMTNNKINEWYDLAMKCGALGGKLIGAGGGGFLMFYVNDKEKFRKSFAESNLSELRFKFDFEGVRTILN